MIVWPEHISLNDWAATLIDSYSTEFLPILDKDENWQEWGTIVAGTGIFARSNIPAPFSLSQGRKSTNFEDWREWAKAVYISFNFRPTPR